MASSYHVLLWLLLLVTSDLSLLSKYQLLVMMMLCGSTKQNINLMKSNTRKGLFRGIVCSLLHPLYPHPTGYTFYPFLQNSNKHVHSVHPYHSPLHT